MSFRLAFYTHNNRPWVLLQQLLLLPAPIRYNNHVAVIVGHYRSKTRFPNLSSSSSLVDWLRFLHPYKAPLPMEVTESGIVNVVRREQLTNALSPMKATELGIVNVVRREQSENALSPMEVTDLGIVNEVRLLR